MKKRFRLMFFAVFVLSLFSCNHTPEITKYKVTYVSTYGEVQEPIKVEENTILYGDQLAELSYEHGIFLGWYNDETKVEAGTFTVTEDVTLTAKWQLDTCFVTFMPGLGIGNNYVKEVDFNTPITIPQNTFNAQIGYKFAGWAKNEEQVVNYNAGDSYTVTEDVSFTAIWIEKDAYSITYHNLKDGDVVAGEKTNPVSYKENQNIRVYSVERIGYIFEGWFENQDYSGNSVSGWAENTKADNIDLYPKFTPITYKIRFNPNGGSGEMKDIECTYDVDFILPDCSFTLTNYRFSKWLLNDKPLTLKKNLTTENNSIVELKTDWLDIVKPLRPMSCLPGKIKPDGVEIECKTPSDTDLELIRIYYESINGKNHHDFREGILPEQKVSLDVPGLDANTEYIFTIVAVDKAGNESEDNENINIRTASGKGINNLNYTVYNAGNKVHFEWEYPDCPNFDKLEILYKTSNDSDYTSKGNIEDKKNTFDLALENAAIHSFKFVIYEKPDTTGNFCSTEVLKEFYKPVPYIYITENTENSVTLKWIDPMPNESLFDNYIIKYSNGIDTNTTKINKGIQTTTIEGLSQDYIYTFMINCETEVNDSIESLITETIGSTSTYEQNNKIAFLGSIYYEDKSYSINYDDSKTPAGIVVKVDENNKPVHIVSANVLSERYYWNNSTTNHQTVYLSGVTDGYSSGEYIDNIYSNIETKITGSGLPKYSVFVPFMKETKEWKEGGITTWFVPMENEFKAVIDKKLLYNDALERCKGNLLFANNKNYYICKFTDNAWYIDNQGVIYKTPTGFIIQYQSMDNVIVRPFAKVN